MACRAPACPRACRQAGALLSAMGELLATVPEFEPEYLVVVHPETLLPQKVIGEDGAVVLLAGKFGDTRLIDNIPFELMQKPE